jgi:hypothetical protein
LLSYEWQNRGLPADHGIYLFFILME